MSNSTKIKRGLVFVLGITLLFILNLNSVSATTTISACPTTISVSGDYNLTANISGTGTCLTLAASNIFLDCNGYTITFDTAGGATTYGIDVVNGTNQLSNITINNCIIQKTVSGGASGIGLRTQRTSGAVISNNIIKTNGTTTNYGIYMLTSSWDNLIENNTIISAGTSTGSAGIYISSDSSENILRNNDVKSYGTTTSYALYVYSDSNYNLVENNNLSSLIIPGSSGNTDMQTVYLSTSKYNNLTNNYIYSQGVTRNYALYFFNLARGNNIINNTIINNGNGTTDYGIYSVDSNSNYFEGNRVLSGGTTTIYGAYFLRANFNTLINNNLSAYSTSTPAYAAFVSNAYGNIFDRTSFYVNGTTTNNAVYFNNGDDNQVSNSYVNITGNGNTNYGIYGIYSNRNLIENNSVYTRGASTNPSIAFSTCKNNIIKNNRLSSFGTTTLNYGIYLTIAENNTITNNNITTAGTTTNYGIYLLTNANENTINNNTIIPGGTTTLYGVFSSASSRNNIYNNYIVSNGSTQSGTTNNWGVYLNANSNDNEVINNTVITGGGTPNYGVYILTDSDRNIIRSNNISAGGTGATNSGVFISASSSNNIEDNIVSTSGTGTDYGIYVYSSSFYNNIKNNTILTSGSTTSYGVYLAVNGVNIPTYNNFTSNSFSTGSSTEFRVGAATIDNLWLIDQTVDTYLFTGVGSLINFKNSTAGEIRFLNRLTGSGSGLTNSIQISDNYAYVDSTISALNKSAEITFYNIPNQTNLGIYKDGVLCSYPNCINLTSLQAGNVTFNVTGWSYYSINASDQTPQIINILAPANNTNITGSNYNFNFTVIDETSTTFRCYLYIDNSSVASNTSVQNNTLTTISASEISGGTHLWYLSCLDQSNFVVYSENRTFQNAIPLITYNSPTNNSYFNNVNYMLLNTTLSDTGGSSFTVYVYGDNSLINTSTNVQNGEFTYNWTGLSLGQHNWSLIVDDGINNSTNQSYKFNLINLTVNCQTGGPYQNISLVLVNGNATDGTSPISSGSTIVDLIPGIVVSSYNVTIDSNGKFESSFVNVSTGNYTINSTVFYQGISKTCSMDVRVLSSEAIGSESTSASLVLDKVISLHELNSTNIVYNITLKSTNSGGSDAIGANLTDSDSTSSPYNLGTLISSQTQSTSYLKSYERNSTNYNVTLVVATINATDSLTSNDISGTSTQNIIAIPATVSNNLVTVIKNVEFLSENETTLLYNITDNFINSGGSDLSGVEINDSDISLNDLIDLNRTQSYSTSGTIYLNKSALSSTYSFVKATATYNSVTYESNQPQISVSQLATNASLSIYKSASIFDSNNTNIIYNITLQAINSGGSNSTSTYVYDSDSTSSPYNLGTLNPGSSWSTTYLINLNKSTFSTTRNLAIAIINGTDSISSNIIQGNSSLISVLIPAKPSSANLVLDKIVSFYNISNTSIVYNITLKSINSGGSNVTSLTLTDSDSTSSPYSISSLDSGESTYVSYLKEYERNSTNYNVTLATSYLEGTDISNNNLTNTSSNEVILLIPADVASEQITILKNIFYNSENSTTMNYTINLQVINSGGIDLSSITVIDSDLSLNTLIDLNRTQIYNYTSTILIDKAASNTNKLFVKATATFNSITYESNQLQIRIPGYGGPADAIVYAPDYVNASTSFNSNITVINQNPDAGQDFTIDYWITSNDESTNYTSGQQTIYVSALGNSTLTVSLTSPSTNGTYRLRALVSWVEGTATAYDSFFILESAPPEEDNPEEQTGHSSSGSSSIGVIKTDQEITGGSVVEVICNPPYIRYGQECCLDINENLICDNDEASNEITSQNIAIAETNEGNSNLNELIIGLKNYYYALVVVIILSLMLTLRKKNRKERQINKITEIPGISVYTSGGKKIGKVQEAYLEKEKLRIYGWLIKLDKPIHKKLHKKYIIIRHIDVNSIKHVMLINDAISEQIDKLSTQEKFINSKTKK